MDNVIMMLNDNDNDGESNLLTASQAESIKSCNLKANKKRRRSTLTSVDHEVDERTSSSSDCNVSIPSLQTQSMDGTTTMDNDAITTGSIDRSSTGSQSQLLPSMKNENDANMKGNSDEPFSTIPNNQGNNGISSLFGNVMKNITASSLSVGRTSQQQQQQPPLLQPPPLSTTTSTAARSDPITPARTLLRTPKSKHKNVAINSPGGFQLLDFVNGFGNSPLFQRSNQVVSKNNQSQQRQQQQLTPDPTLRRKAATTEIASVPCTPCNTTPRSNRYIERQASSSSRHPLPISTIPATPRHDVEWHECLVEKKQVYWTDWSIKSTIELQYQPSNALDMLLSKQSEKYQRCAMQQFATMNHDSITGSCRLIHDDVSTAAIDFYAALSYWQHPAIHPLPDSFFQKQSNQHPQPLKSHVTSNLSKPYQPLDAVSSYNGNNSNSRLAMPPPTKHMRAFTTTATTKSNNASKRSTNDSMIQTRIMEWQEAFQSLYLGWIDKIRFLNQQWNEIYADQNNSLGALDSFYKNVSETYFYAVGMGHTILFRVGLNKYENDEPTDSHSLKSKAQLQPEIILSSSSKTLRQKLRSSNVDLHLLNEWNCHTGIFDDDWLFGSISEINGKTVDTTESTSPNVMAELIALRRQQMTGWRVGPDIAVVMKPKHRPQNQLILSPKRVPPLRIAGIENCSSFFDIYYHSLGQVAVTNYVETERIKDLTVDVPLLLCRKIGPFLHASIKSYNPKKRESHAGEDVVSRNTTIDICGYILPCAVRNLTCAVIDYMLVSKTSTVTNGKTESETGDKKRMVGSTACSNHFIIQTTVHQGNELKNISGLGGIGTHSSRRLNGAWNFLDSINDKIDAQYCHHDEVLNLAIWDESRPTSLAVKLGHLTTFVSD